MDHFDHTRYLLDPDNEDNLAWQHTSVPPSPQGKLKSPIITPKYPVAWAGAPHPNPPKSSYVSPYGTTGNVGFNRPLSDVPSYVSAPVNFDTSPPLFGAAPNQVFTTDHVRPDPVPLPQEAPRFGWNPAYGDNGYDTTDLDPSFMRINPQPPHVWGVSHDAFGIPANLEAVLDGQAQSVTGSAEKTQHADEAYPVEEALLLSEERDFLDDSDDEPG